MVAPLSEVGEYGGNLSVGIPSAWSWFGDPQSAVGPETLMRLASDYTGVVPNIVRSWDWEPDDKTVVMQNRVCSVLAWGEQPTMQPYVRITSNPQSHTLERNAYYWKVDPAGNQLPYIDGVTIHVVQDREVMVLKAIQGEFDLFGQNSALARFPVYQENKEKAGYDVYNWVVTDANQMGIQFNLTIEDPVKREIFRDKRFWIAFSHANDRDEINRFGSGGSSTPPPWTPPSATG